MVGVMPVSKNKFSNLKRYMNQHLASLLSSRCHGRTIGVAALRPFAREPGRE
jgi:hypothetical protein